jgi:CheY-like chemotaxis protein
MLYHNILLIDDDTEDQEIFLSAMESVSTSVVCTTITDAREALHRLSRKDVTTDLIFLDLNMPAMTGQQFLTAIKQNDTLNHIPVIILSTSANLATIVETKQLGAKDFITKPDTFNDFISILRSHIVR